MLLLVTLFLGLAHVAAITNCKPLKRWEDLAVKHSWIEIPGGWEYKAPAPADHVFELRVGMKQHRMDELIANLMEISDPEHPRFVFCLCRCDILVYLQPRYAEHLTKDKSTSSQRPIRIQSGLSTNG
jgi:tripeptidyl-peptidase-1